MHIVFIVVGNRGGMAHYPANLINAVREKCETSVIAVTSDKSEISELVEIDDFVEINVGASSGVRSLFRQAGGLVRLLAAVRARKPDLVHIPFYNGATTFLPPFLTLIGCKVVATIHDPQEKEGLDTRYSIRQARFDSRFMDAILVHGEQTVTQAVESGFPREKLKQVPHGLYPHFRTTPIEHSDDEILFFGTIRRDKGFDRIPEIAERVIRETDATVRVAGALGEEGWGRDVVETLRDIDGVIVDEGYVPNEYVQSYFERAAVVVLPYVDATSSGILLTAYTFETPVVVTDVGDLGWMVRNDDTGLVADAGSVDDIAQKTVELLGHDLRETKQANVLAVKEQHSWDRITDELVAIYRTVIGSETVPAGDLT